MTSGAVQQTEPWNIRNWRWKGCDFTTSDRPKSVKQHMRRSLTCTFAYHRSETGLDSKYKTNTPLWYLYAQVADPDCADSECHPQFHISEKWETASAGIIAVDWPLTNRIESIMFRVLLQIRHQVAIGGPERNETESWREQFCVHSNERYNIGVVQLSPGYGLRIEVLVLISWR